MSNECRMTPEQWQAIEAVIMAEADLRFHANGGGADYAALEQRVLAAMYIGAALDTGLLNSCLGLQTQSNALTGRLPQ